MSVAFERIMGLCRKPSLAAMREALANRDGLLPEEKFNSFIQGISTDTLASRNELLPEEKWFVTYVAGFSHYRESSSFLERHGLDLLTSGPAIYDARANALHVKVFIAEITHTLHRLSLQNISQRYGARIFTNSVYVLSSDGSYIEDFGKRRREMKMTYLEYLSDAEIHLSGIYEQIFSHSFDRRALSVDSLIFHFATQNIRNIPQDLPRLFMNVHSIVFFNDRDLQINLSIKNLRAAREIHVWLKSMFWYVIENPLAEQVVEFVEELGGRYKLIPFRGLDGDYLPEIISDITTSLTKLKIPY
jgi:hypothetical protein